MRKPRDSYLRWWMISSHLLAPIRFDAVRKKTCGSSCIRRFALLSSRICPAHRRHLQRRQPLLNELVLHYRCILNYFPRSYDSHTHDRIWDLWCSLAVRPPHTRDDGTVTVESTTTETLITHEKTFNSWGRVRVGHGGTMN